MRKKIDVNDLRLGMYVEELDRPWVGTRFMFQGFEVSSQDALDELRRVCKFVYIETDREKINKSGARKGSLTIPMTPVSSPDKKIQPGSNIGRVLLQEPARKKRWQDQTTLDEELGAAHKIETEALNALNEILEDVRMGRSLKTAAAKVVVGEIVESVIRNPDAMVVLSQLKNVDEYTVLHSLRVCTLALVFGRHLELSREELNLLGVGALLHDVGKMKVPVEILNKPSKLTNEEFEIMKSHVPEGVRIVRSAPGISPLSLEVVARHHERYGGDGYSSGILGDTIGTFGLISGIVDCYDAITSDRVYHKGMTTHEALTRMYGWRTTDFHPGLVEQFIQCMGIYPIGSLVEMNTGAVGVVTTINRARRLRPSVVLILNQDKIPYARPQVVDLMKTPSDSKGNKLEISKVLPNGTYGINPTDYLPVMELMKK